MDVTSRIRAFLAGTLDRDELFTALLAHTWWVPIDDDIAQAQYTSDGAGYLLCYSGPDMDTDYDTWRRLSGAEVVAELKDDPEVGVVFDYNYPWALHIKAAQTAALFPLV